MPTAIGSTSLGASDSRLQPVATRTTTNDAITILVNDILNPNNADDSLSPENLILVAQRRLHDVNSQIRAAVGEMNTRGETLSYLRAATEAINRFRQNHHDNSASLRIDTETVTFQTPDGETKTMTILDALKHGGMDASRVVDPTHPLDDEGNRSLLEGIRSQIDTVNEGADIAQLRLQQLIGERGQITQTTSQVLAAIHENAKSIVQNTRA